MKLLFRVCNVCCLLSTQRQIIHQKIGIFTTCIVPTKLVDTRFVRLQAIKVLWNLQFLGYLRTLSLKFQKATSKIEVVLALPCWLSQLNWDSQQHRPKTTSILLVVFWNFKLKVLKYPRNCRFHNTLIPWSLTPYLSELDFSNSPVWNIEFDELYFFPSLQSTRYFFFQV